MFRRHGMGPHTDDKFVQMTRMPIKKVLDTIQDLEDRNLLENADQDVRRVCDIIKTTLAACRVMNELTVERRKSIAAHKKMIVLQERLIAAQNEDRKKSRTLIVRLVKRNAALKKIIKKHNITLQQSDERARIPQDADASK